MFFSGAVRNTLFALALTALLPVVCVIVYSGLEDSARKEAAILEDAEELVRAIAFNKQSMMENTRTMLIALSHFEEISRVDLPATRAIFRAVLQQTPFYSSLVLISPEGKLLAASSSLATPPSFTPSQLEDLWRRNRLSIGAAYFDELSGLSHLRFAYPIRDADGKPVCLIAGGLRTDNYVAAAHKDLFPEAARLLILDGAGTALSSYPESPFNPEDVATGWRMMREQGTVSGTLAQSLVSGDKRVVLYRHLYLDDSTEPYLTVLLSLPEQSVSAAGRKELFRNLRLLSLAACATLFIVGVLGAKVIRNPLLVILAAAKRLRQGDYSARTAMPELHGEFGALALTFNDMAEAIEARDQERLQAKKISDANNAAKSEFLAAMSHAIRTPMNSVIGIAYLLMKTDLDPRQHGYVNRIYTSANTLLGIINDIQDFSNIESGRFSIDWIPFRLSETLDNIMTLYSHKAEERQLALILKIGEGVPDALHGDPLRLGQVLTNLLGNSVKFTESGSVTVRCVLSEEACPPEMYRSSLTPGEELVRLAFTVEDTGIGMTKEQITALFDAYVQADDSITRKYGGTGLGLAISRRLVQLMGGEIAVHSIYGSGTSMTFNACFGKREEEDKGRGQALSSPGADDAAQVSTLPSSVPECGSPAKGKPQGLLAALHILLVEDNPVNQEIAAELLREAGARVSLASNGAQALDILTGDYPAPPVDLILMDVQMPVMDGFEATSRIRAMENFTTLPIVAMTAHALNEEREQCLEAGMNAHISKPIEIDKFFRTIADCMNLSHHLDTTQNH